MCITSLPAELRLRVYDFLLPANPLSYPRTTYAGLLYSCRGIRAELEPQILKRVARFLKELQTRCRGVFDDGDAQYSGPTSLADAYNLKFARPNRMRLFHRGDPFMAVLYLHFSTLTITALPQDAWYKVNPYADVSSHFRNVAECLMHWIDSVNNWEGQTSVRKIVYEWPADAQPLESAIYKYPPRILKGSEMWKADLRCSAAEDGSGQKVDGVVITRR